MTEPMIGTVLITGCGGDIGICLARILRAENITRRVIGCDIHDDHPHPFFFDEFTTLPRVTAPNYANALSRLVKKFQIELIVPASEPEIRGFFKSLATREYRGVPILVADPQSLEIGLDKLKTVDFLRLQGLPYPYTTLGSGARPDSFPCILKQREGAGSKSISIVTEDNYDQFVGVGDDYIWQEYLEPDDEEYTCGLFRSEDGRIRSIVFRRKLLGGLTGSGVVVDNADITSLLVVLAEKLGLVGSINVQLRLTNRGPVIFEINPRFSSTVMFRHQLGFKDFWWCLQQRYGLPIDEYLAPPAGTKIYRVCQEIILRGE